MDITVKSKIPPISLISFDLDGTLLNQEHEVSGRSREAITRLKDNGYKLLVTTGRTLPETRNVCDGIAFDGYICSNGMVIYENDFTLIHMEIIPGYAVIEILNQLKRAKINYELHDENGELYVIEEDEDFLKKRIDRVRMIPQKELFYNILSKKINIVKFLILTIHNNIIIPEHLQVDTLPVNLIIVNQHNVEINKAGINKWIGLQYYLKRFCLPADQILAFGDGANDMEILKRSGWSVAMENAGQEVKREAKDITLSNDNDGVAFYIENNILNYT